MTMFGQFTLAVVVLGVFILGYAFGYAAALPNDDEDDVPGAATADELEQ